MAAVRRPCGAAAVWLPPCAGGGAGGWRGRFGPAHPAAVAGPAARGRPLAARAWRPRQPRCRGLAERRGAAAGAVRGTRRRGAERRPGSRPGAASPAPLSLREKSRWGRSCPAVVGGGVGASVRLGTTPPALSAREGGAHSAVAAVWPSGTRRGRVLQRRKRFLRPGWTRCAGWFTALSRLSRTPPSLCLAVLPGGCAWTVVFTAENGRGEAGGFDFNFSQLPTFLRV